MKNKRPFGYSLLLDFYNCDPKILDDLEQCYRFLHELVSKLGMQEQSPPFIFRSPAAFLEKAGLSGWVPLIESGIQLHTLVLKKFASLDIYSCGKFNNEQITDEAKQFFRSNKIEIIFYERGKEYYDIV